MADEPAKGSGFALTLAAIAALAIAVLIWLVLRRRRPRDEEVAFEAPRAIQKAPVPKAPPPLAEPAAVPMLDAPALIVDLATTRMSASLVNATVAYRLMLSASVPVEDIAVRGGMISAHASRPAEEQLEARDAPQLHRLSGLGAGEIVEVTGEIRLPLSEITPIRHGDSALFVPLVRLLVTATVNGRPHLLRAAFVVGIEESASGERLQPFRLDLGPRVYPKVGQRALAVPAFG